MKKWISFSSLPGTGIGGRKSHGCPPAGRQLHCFKLQKTCILLGIRQLAERKRTGSLFSTHNAEDREEFDHYVSDVIRAELLRVQDLKLHPQLVWELSSSAGTTGYIKIGGKVEQDLCLLHI